jgi:hypothetical protein
VTNPAAPTVAGDPYLVVISEIIVAEDIAQTILMRAPGAQIITARTLAEAQSAIRHHPRLTVAFVEASEPCFAASTLAAELSLRKARVVLLTDRPRGERQGRNWDLLDMPFTETALSAFLI